MRQEPRHPFSAATTPNDFIFFDYSTIDFKGDDSDIVLLEDMLSDSAGGPANTADGREVELLDPPTRLKTKNAANLLGIIKKRVDPDEDPPELYFGKGYTRFAIRIPDGMADRVIFEFPQMKGRHNEMVTYVLQTKGHVWHCAGRWNIPVELPGTALAIQFVYSFTGTPFESPAFEQHAEDAYYLAPGLCYRADRVSESARHFLNLARVAWDSEGVSFQQLEDVFYFYNEQNNNPPLEPAEMAEIVSAVVEEVCNVG